MHGSFSRRSLHPRLGTAALAFVLGAAAAACSGAAEPEEGGGAAGLSLAPVAVEPDADALAAVQAMEDRNLPDVPTGQSLGAPEMTVVRDAVLLRGTGAESSRAIEVDESVAIAFGDTVEVGSSGTAVLQWPDGVRAEILGGAGVTIDSTPEGLRQAILVQSGGTARYSLPRLDSPAALAIHTSAGTLLTVGGSADLIVGVRPAGELSDDAQLVWVMVVQGEVALVGDAVVASADSSAAAPRARALLGAGEAVVIGGDSEISPLVLPIDVISVETWYGQVLSGYTDTPIVDAAFRCRIATDGAELRDVPTMPGQRDRAAAGAGMPLAAGALIDAKQRSADGLWIEVIAVDTGSVGWLRADALDCIAPVAVLPPVDPQNLVLASSTPTPAFAPISVLVSFSADDDDLEIPTGGCTTLRWDVPVGGAVAFDGLTVPGKGWQKVCPEATRAYTLRWVDAAGNPQSRTLTIEVDTASVLHQSFVIDDSRQVGGTGGSSSAPPTPTICPEDCIVEMPTMAPTPTIPPRPTRAPTVVPDPTSPPAPTDPLPPAEPTDPPADPTSVPPPPVPTDPPPPEPTDLPGEPPATPPPGPTPTPPPGPSEPPPPGTPTPEATLAPTEEPTATP